MGSFFKKKQQKSTQPTMTAEELFQHHAAQGEQIDLLVGQGRAREANQHFQRLFQSMLASGVIDEFLMAKLVIGSMASAIASNDVGLAHKIWTGSLPGPGELYQVGVRAVETGVCDLHDLAVYKCLGSFLHACNPDLDAATEAVNREMRVTVEMAYAELSPQITNALVGHWKYCLKRIYDDDPAPDNLYADVESTAAGLGLGVPDSGRMLLMRPSPWRTATAVLGTVGPNSG